MDEIKAGVAFAARLVMAWDPAEGEQPLTLFARDMPVELTLVAFAHRRRLRVCIRLGWHSPKDYQFPRGALDTGTEAGYLWLTEGPPAEGVSAAATRRTAR